jgi:alkylation response protein AidB-like acyl-CoA dehydrogenase
LEFAQSDIQRKHIAAFADFAQTALDFDVETADEKCVFPQQQWQHCANYGVFRWIIPEALGGEGHDVITTTHLLEQLGYSCHDNGFAFAIAAQIWAVQKTLLQFATDDQINRYLLSQTDGSLRGCFAITESGSGSDAFALSTTADRHGDEYILNGEKRMVTMAPEADFAIVFAQTDADKGQWGLTAFIVDLKQPGITQHPNDKKMGLRTVPFGRLTFDNCRVPPEAILGKPGSGASIFNFTQSSERSLVLAPQLGAMRRIIETCATFSKSRIRQGAAISRNQSVSNKIADMSIRLDASQLLVYKAATLLEQKKNVARESAVTKAFVSQAFVDTCHDAIAIHGGSGYMTENGIERNLRDAIAATIYGGTVDVQRNIIARHHGL